MAGLSTLVGGAVLAAGLLALPGTALASTGHSTTTHSNTTHSTTGHTVHVAHSAHKVSRIQIGTALTITR